MMPQILTHTKKVEEILQQEEQENRSAIVSIEGKETWYGLIPRYTAVGWNSQIYSIPGPLIPQNTCTKGNSIVEWESGTCLLHSHCSETVGSLLA